VQIILDFFSVYRIPITILFILLFSFIGSRVLQWMMDRGVKESSFVDIDPTRYKFFKNAVNFLVAFTALALIIYTIPKLRSLALTLMAGAGVFLAILGFAAQQAFSNIINGVFLVISKPYRVHDMIKVGDRDYGIVEDITLRHTVIKDFKNKRIIIPNSIMASETIINDSIGDNTVCRWIEVGISYDSDVDKAIRIIQEESEKHPLCIDHREKKEIKNGLPKVIVRHIGFGDSSINLRAYVWTDDPLEAVQMQSDINRSIKKRFDAEGIEIPFPHRTIVYKSDLPPNA